MENNIYYETPTYIDVGYVAAGVGYILCGLMLLKTSKMLYDIDDYWEAAFIALAAIGIIVIGAMYIMDQFKLLP